MIIFSPDKYLVPSYRISPFTTSHVSKNNAIDINKVILDFDKYIFEKHQNYTHCFTKTGREAINIALRNYNLTKDDVVTIFTTTNNFYISGCVTKEIEKFCKWSRNLEANTKIILINHEFSFPRNDVKQLSSIGLPIIEDCAFSLLNDTLESVVGTVGDFIIYSLPKTFPIQFGGILLKSNRIHKDIKNSLNEDELNYLKKVCAFYLNDEILIKKKRIDNYKFLLAGLQTSGCKERIFTNQGVIPGVCLFYCPAHVNLQNMKDFLWSCGIQCSVFYGEQSFFLPVHQNLTPDDLQYILTNTQSFINEGWIVR